MKLVTLDQVSCFLAELIGTGFLTFMGCMNCLQWGDKPPSHLQIIFGFSMVVFFIIQIFAHISGAHLNPAVSLSALILGLIDLQTFAHYGLAQLIGGFMGFGLLKALTPDKIYAGSIPEGGAGLCVTAVNPLLSPTQGLLIEFFATAALILVFCSVVDPRNAKNSDGVSLKFGFVIFALAITTGPYTGGSFNPARSLAPAIWNGYWTHHWVSEKN